MTEGDPDTPPGLEDSRLDDLGRRLEAARARRARRGGRRGAAPGNQGRAEAMGIGMRIAVELAAAVIVGAGIGILLDRWLGTAPWLLILFFVLGSAAGFVNVHRTATEYDRRRREGRDGGTPPGTGDSPPRTGGTPPPH